jgi:hypothetical protein
VHGINKFLPEKRVERDGMIQSHARSSTSTKNSQNKNKHRRGQSASLNFRNHFGGRSVMVADRRWDSRVVDRDDMTNDEPNSNEQNTHDGIYDFDGHRR